MSDNTVAPVEFRLYPGAVCRTRKLKRGHPDLHADYGPPRGDEFIVIYLGRAKKDESANVEKMLSDIGLEWKP